MLRRRVCLFNTMEENYKPQPGDTIAVVEWLRGKRLMSEFMRNAGLGIQNVGVKERVRLTYKPGEVVDEARVMRAITGMQKGLDDENSEWEITNPKVIEIFTVVQPNTERA